MNISLNVPSARDTEGVLDLSTEHHQQPKVLYLKLQLRKIEVFWYKKLENQGLCDIMDWINCNSCCRQPGDERERTFVLTNCGHIFCDLCLAQVESPDKCSACNSKCQMMQLSSKMKPDAEMFFLEPGELLKRQYNQVNRLLEFQKEHRVRLVSFHRRTLQKYKDLQKQHASTTSCMQELEKKYSSASNRVQELEVENRKLRSMISNQGNPGGVMSPPNYSPSLHDKYQRGSMSQKSPTGSQILLPQEGTRISPGRLTLVKGGGGGQGPRSGNSPTNTPLSRSPTNMQVSNNNMRRSPTNAHPPHLQSMTQSSQVHASPGTYLSPSQLQLHPNHLSQRQLTQSTPTLSGSRLYRGQSPVTNCNPSPTSRNMSSSVGRLSLLASGQQQQQQSAGASHYQYPSYTSHPHHGSNPDLRLAMQSRPLSTRSVTPISSISDNHSSNMLRQGHHNSYDKFT